MEPVEKDMAEMEDTGVLLVKFKQLPEQMDLVAVAAAELEAIPTAQITISIVELLVGLDVLL